RQNDRIVFPVTPAASPVARFEPSVRYAGAGQMRPALSEKTGIDLDAGDIGRAPREQRGEVAATRADLEHRFVRFELQLLQDPSFHLGRPHAFAVAQRYFEIGERQGPIRGRDEVFAPDL